MSTAQELLQKLCFYGEQIRKRPSFDEAVEHHYDLITAMYKKNALFYKTILKESRIYITMSMLCFHYARGGTSLSDVREYCASMKFASANSIDSLFFFMRVSNRLEAVRGTENKRILMISPTEKLLKEVRQYVSCALIPLNKIFPELSLPPDLLEDPARMKSMYDNMYNVLINRIVINRTIPGVHFFTEKDSGHMVFISLYLEALKHSRNNSDRLGIFEYPYAAVSKMLAVSRTHVRRIVNAAEKHGWMTVYDNSRIEVTPAFMDLLRNYMGLYFALGMNSLDLDPANIRCWADR